MTALKELADYVRETAMLQSVSAALEWDERTYMPPAAASYRAEQVTLLSGLIHQRKTSTVLAELLAAAEGDVVGSPPHEDDNTIVRQTRREFEKLTKVPQRLVEELTKNGMDGQQAWIEARKQRDFSMLQPYLERTILLLREKADAVGYESCVYDALLDDYEPGENTTRVAEVFSSLRDELVPLLQRVQSSDVKAPIEILRRHYPTKMQHEAGMLAADMIGFDFRRGRLDVTNHPFCTELGPHDCRITTRYDESFFSTAFFGTLHEAGHGIYEQGLRNDLYGLPPGQHVSMGIHESQSRLWENLVGRSRPFWQHFFPRLQRIFPEATEGTSAEQFFRAVNAVKPSLIRVEADEITYNLHIIIRFELEQELMNLSLDVADLPTAWNDRYEQVLGITPPHDGDGVLQDVHWSTANFGYFPTYTLGNLLAAQFFQQAEHDLGDLTQQISRGEFEPLRIWLRTQIHERGQCYTSAELVRLVTGQPLSIRPLLDGLVSKMNQVYGV
jgi:carboxypeptidase Taq